jgi:hypothetical protein
MSEFELLLSILSLVVGGLQLGGNQMLGPNGQLISGWICVGLGFVLFLHYFSIKTFKNFINPDGSKFQKFRGFIKRKIKWLKKYSKNIPEDFSMKETHWQLNLIKGLETALGKEKTEIIRNLFENWNLNRKNKLEELNNKIKYLESLILIQLTSVDVLPDFDPRDLEQYESNESID